MAAYGEIGRRPDCSSENGARLLAPYTELEDPKISRETLKFLAELEQIHRAGHVHLLVEPRLLNRRANAGPGRKMNDDVRPDAGDGFPQAVHRANVLLEKIEWRDFADRFEIRFFPRGGIELVEIVHDAQLNMVAQQSLRHMRSDKPGSARQQNALRISGHALIPPARKTNGQRNSNSHCRIESYIVGSGLVSECRQYALTSAQLSH